MAKCRDVLELGAVEQYDSDAALQRAVGQQVRHQAHASCSAQAGTGHTKPHVALGLTRVRLMWQVALKHLRVSIEVVQAVGRDVTLRLHLHLPSW